MHHAFALSIKYRLSMRFSHIYVMFVFPLLLAGRNTAQSSPRRKAEPQRSRKLPPSDAQGCFIPYEENALPPICVSSSGNSNSICDVEYKEVRNDADLLERLQRETLKFIVKNNFYVLVKVVNSEYPIRVLL